MARNSIALCVPAFNAASVLPRLFDSVRKQTVAFDEILVYDDASTDDTATVARSYGAVVIRGQLNQGCSIGKNILLSHIGTSWVHFHDADDALAEEFVERAKERITEGNFDALLFNYEQVDEQSGLQMSRSQFEVTNLQNDPVRYMLLHTVNNGGVYSVEFLRRIGGFDSDPSVRFNEDRAFHLRLAEAGARFGVDSYIGSRFYFNPGSMSGANRVHCLMAHQEITHRFLNRHSDGYSDEIGQISWRNATGLAACLNWSAADACIRIALDQGLRLPSEGSKFFKFLCLINPHWALRVREYLIRCFRPRNRICFPRREVMK